MFLINTIHIYTNDAYAPKVYNAGNTRSRFPYKYNTLEEAQLALKPLFEEDLLVWKRHLANKEVTGYTIIYTIIDHETGELFDYKNVSDYLPEAKKVLVNPKTAAEKPSTLKKAKVYGNPSNASQVLTQASSTAAAQAHPGWSFPDPGPNFWVNQSNPVVIDSHNEQNSF